MDRKCTKCGKELRCESNIDGTYIDVCVECSKKTQKHDDFHGEFRRVFGSCVVDEDDPATVRADDWPDYVRYDESVAIRVLKNFPIKYAVDDAEGDAQVCAALEDAGAVID